jgi:hypothetical protein
VAALATESHFRDAKVAQRRDTRASGDDGNLGHVEMRTYLVAVKELWQW